MLRQGSSLRPPHDRVEVSVEIVVRGAGASGPEESGEDQKGEPKRVDVDTGRGDIPRGGDKQEKRVAPEFHQLDIVCEGHGERSSRANRPAFLTLCRRAVLTRGRRLFPKSRTTVPVAIRPNRTIRATWIPRLAQRASVRGHREDDVGGLETDAGKGHQLLSRAFGREAEDALDLTVPPVPDRGRRRADPWGLLTRKTRVPDRPRDFLIGSAREPIRRDAADPAA